MRLKPPGACGGGTGVCTRRCGRRRRARPAPPPPPVPPHPGRRRPGPSAQGRPSCSPRGQSTWSCGARVWVGRWWGEGFCCARACACVCACFVFFWGGGVRRGAAQMPGARSPAAREVRCTVGGWVGGGGGWLPAAPGPAPPTRPGRPSSAGFAPRGGSTPRTTRPAPCTCCRAAACPPAGGGQGVGRASAVGRLAGWPGAM